MSEKPEKIADFRRQCSEDREAFWHFHRTIVPGEGDSYSDANPAFSIAPAYFETYVRERPSRVATMALGLAFEMWDHAKGIADQVDEAFAVIPHDEELVGEADLVFETWRKVAVGVQRCLARDGRTDEGLALLEAFADATANPAIKATMLWKAGFYLEQEEQLERARAAYEQILALEAGACAWYTFYRARGALAGWSSLKIGQPAPSFAKTAIDGKPVTLEDNRGRFVLLDFWSTTCPFCFPEFERIKHLRRAHGERLSVIGACCDSDLEALRRGVERECLDWPHVCQGNRDWDEDLYLLFNVTGVPRNYLIDPKGRIVARDLRGDELLHVVDEQMARKDT